MKRFILSAIALAALALNTFAQAPESMKYQSVVRDASSNIIPNQAVGMQFKILQGSPSGTNVYQETFSPTTNAYGLVIISLGTGSVVSGIFSDIDWANGPYFIETGLDVTGGSSYAIMGTSQFLSVPYAFHANSADNFTGDFTLTVSQTGDTLSINGGNSILVPGISALNYPPAPPANEQRAIMVYQGATWCGPCGANGEPTKNHLETTYGSDVIILNSQGAWAGDAISTPTSFGNIFGSEFANFYTPVVSSVPHCYFSAANYAMTDHGFNTSPTQYDAIVSTILSTTLEVSVTATATITGGTVTVNTTSEFQSALGEHFIAVYLLEDSVMATQTITGQADAVTAHNNVVRAAASNLNALGTESMGASFTANQQVSGIYTITVPATVVNNQNLQVAVVIYEANQADGISNAVIVDVN